MVVGRVMGAGTGKHTISMKLAQGNAGHMSTLCGVVRDGVLCNEEHYQQESTVGWFMFSGKGSLLSNAKYNAEDAGRIEPGQVLSMQVDMDAGTLKFWVDGKPHGPGYTSGVAGPLRWATRILHKHNNVEIVPTPELQP